MLGENNQRWSGNRDSTSSHHAIVDYFPVESDTFSSQQVKVVVTGN